MNFGITPVRLNPEDGAEVVWASRIDPVRARIDSIPYPESGFKHGDIVLHDGAAVGYREIGENEYPVFNVLELFESSAYETTTVTVRVSDDSDLKELEELFASTQHQFEDWTSNVGNICKQCSEGRPHDNHDQELEGTWNPERTLGVAVFASEDIELLFDVWDEKSNGTLVRLGASE